MKQESPTSKSGGGSSVKIENRLHELRGDGMVNTYNVLDVISKTLENVNDLLNK